MNFSTITLPTLFVIFLIFNLSIVVHAQVDEDFNAQHLLVKTDLASYVDGTYSVAAEYRISVISAELALGLQRMPLIQRVRQDLWYTLFAQNDFSQEDDIQGGNTFRGSLRYYNQSEPNIGGFDSYYTIVTFRRIQYKLPDLSRSTNEFFFGGGLEFISHDRLVCDFNVGVGFRWHPNWEGFIEREASYNVSFQIGYRIF